MCVCVGVGGCGWVSVGVGEVVHVSVSMFVWVQCFLCMCISVLYILVWSCSDTAWYTHVYTRSCALFLYTVRGLRPRPRSAGPVRAEEECM